MSFPILPRSWRAVAASLLLPSLAAAQAADSHAELRRAVVGGYAAWCHQVYGECAAKAVVLQSAIAALLARPEAATLLAAREAWVDARRVYGQTEALRFYDGPIEPLEPLLNAWPVDEAFLDYVQGRPGSGIVHDRANFPNLAETVLVLANERGGEANVSVGWHAIEFLLWGQDCSADGPGDRPPTDYAIGVGPDAARRREYLTVATALLVRQLRQLQSAWAPGADNYRRRFEADADGAVRRMLTGAVVLSAFELGGERLAVAYETQDQEQEHSCFSDTSCLDLEANQLGILAVCKGSAEGAGRPGLLALVRAVQPALAADLEKKLGATLAKLRAIPPPFDVAMRGADDTPGRRAIREAMATLDEQTEVLTIVGRVLGHDLPLKPGG